MKAKRIMAWLLALAVTVSGNPAMVHAEEAEREIQQETLDNMEDVSDEGSILADEEEDEIEDMILEEEQSEAYQEEADCQILEADDVVVFSGEEETADDQNPETKYLPGDKTVTCGETFWIWEEYEELITDEYGRDMPVRNIKIENVEDSDSEPICEAELQDAGGWIVRAVRPGKVKITLFYIFQGKEKEHCMTVTVNDAAEPLKFHGLREKDYWTYVFENETSYEVSVDTEKLEPENASIQWEIGLFDQFSESFTEVSEDQKFWSFDETNPNKIIIHGSQLKEAQAKLQNYGEGSNWYEVRAYAVVNGEKQENSKAAFGLRETQSVTIDYLSTFPVQNDDQFFVSDTVQIPDKYKCWIRDGEHPNGGYVEQSITDVKVVGGDSKVTKTENGWNITATESTRSTIAFTFATPFKDAEYSEFSLRFSDKVYRMDLTFDDGKDWIVAGKTKKMKVNLYYRTKEGAEVPMDSVEYTIDADCTEAKKVSVSQKDSTISLTTRSAEESYTIDLNIGATLNEKDKFENALWWASKIWKIKVVSTYDCEHKWESTETAATCGKDGSKHKICTICDKEDDEIIPATGNHSYKWVTDKEATCGGAGRRHEECEVCGEIGETEKIEATGNHSYKWVTDKEATCGEAGHRHEECKVCGATGKTESTEATGHKMEEWKVVRAATAVTEGILERNCEECGNQKETASIAKLKATLTLNVPVNKTLPMKMKQTFQLNASELAEGDKVVAWTSSNNKIATVSGNGKITAQKKAGSAQITVQLASGMTAKFTVKVQKAAVATSSITVLNKATGAKVPKTVNLKAKEKFTVTATVLPVTSKQKVTYSSSNKKIATVSAKGVITAKKNGTAKITVKSGKKKVTIKVKVTK